MGKRGKRQSSGERGSFRSADDSVRKALGPRPPRAPDRHYSFGDSYLAILQELQRLVGATEPLLDLAAFSPGVESVETVSRVLIEKLDRHFDQHVFLAFCRLNAERVLDYVQDRLDQGAWPFEGDEVLAEVYARSYRSWSEGRSLGPQVIGVSLQQLLQGPVYLHLIDAVDEILVQRIAHLRSFRVPLPGVPLPPMKRDEKNAEILAARLQDRGFDLDEDSLQHWVAHCFLQLEADQRRALSLREQRDFTIHAIAAELQLTEFQTALLLREARKRLDDEFDRLISIYFGEPEQQADRPVDSADDPYAENGGTHESDWKGGDSSTTEEHDGDD